MATSRTASNAYFELLKELERDLFPVVAAATQTRRATHPSGTFPLGTPPPSIFHEIKAARGLSGLYVQSSLVFEAALLRQALMLRTNPQDDHFRRRSFRSLLREAEKRSREASTLSLARHAD